MIDIVAGNPANHAFVMFGATFGDMKSGSLKRSGHLGMGVQHTHSRAPVAADLHSRALPFLYGS